MKKSVISILSTLVGVAVGAVATGKASAKKYNTMKELSDRHLALFTLMNQWVKVKNEGKDLVAYLEENGYKKIAIYGMSYVGETLFKDLQGTDIQVAYGIDRRGDSIYTDIDVFTMEDDLDDVDVVIVTAITFFDEIEEKLCEKVTCPIVSIEDILYEI